MADGLLLIAVPASSPEDVKAIAGALESVGVKHSQFAVREPGWVMAADHDRLVPYFGEGWTGPLGLGSVAATTRAGALIPWAGRDNQTEGAR